ncbi:hypothetical protein FVEN_g10632 [Fusarium venenatum]|uniref:Uncharacterized protein n=1 Tax=Fusarium venenatum TaxID=56646 RepID=A0A2L2TJ94_9HYPO|nr:uncharacterized protein FVRRES_10146 [Fusarium venenatum]KAG8351283.1 hypothetical protein FVEN_g10632 [Fusarium venenatum]KAH6966779.1 hypothetical protein EDB82DRAFT_481078 [Fusarium venenatum]CEI70069.1 unnamed protein product [Fusarium venenatum]
MSSPKVDCSQWMELNDFSSYIRLLASKTQFKKDNLEVCQNEICTAVYGTGNPDISGIGVAIGYVLEITLSVFLSLAVIVLKQSEKTSQWHRIAKTGLAAFVDSAAYFALSLQLATIAVLVRKDYGISTADLGAIEARISQTVAVVSMMPLLYPVALLEPRTKTCPRDNVKHNARLLLLSLIIALSFYPFLSRCIHAFDVSPIGNGEGSEVSSTNWSAIEDMCFPQEYRHLGETMTYRSLNGLELTASLIAYLFSFWLLAGLPKTHPHLNEKAQEGQESGVEPSWRELVNVWFSDRPVAAMVPLFVVVGLSVPLLSVIFTLRKVQGNMSENMGQEYAGNEWGFGQIISIILFIPVAVDMGYQWRFGLAYEQ